MTHASKVGLAKAPTRNTSAVRTDVMTVGRRLSFNRQTALAFLRQISVDRATMLELRRLYAEEVRRSLIHNVRDETVLVLLSERIARDELSVVVLQDLVRPGLPEGDPPQEPAATADPAEDERTASITNPRWSMRRVSVGADVKAVFTYSGFVDDKSVTVTFFECNADGTRKKVHETQVQVTEESGDFEVSWKRDPDAARADLEEDTAEGDVGPLEYVFTAESKKAGHSGDSGPLWLTNTVTVKLQKDGAADDKPRIVLLTDHEKELRVKAENGEATFEGVIVGPIKVRLGHPRFVDLAWSKRRVPVGQPVDAVFHYEDAIAGMVVTVFVYEMDPGGVTEEVHRFDNVTLEAEKGVVNLSFTRNEAEAADDLAADQRRGDNTPVEYRYLILAADGTRSDLSNPLWLTNTVKINLKDSEGNAANLPRILVLTDAAGEEKRVQAKDGVATFDEVLVGPINVRLARPRFTGLGWSKPKGKAGEAVNAVFKYEDALAGMMVDVVIWAFDFATDVEELERISVQLPDSQGQIEAPWTCTRGHEKKKGPMEIRYCVTMADGNASPMSRALTQ